MLKKSLALLVVVVVALPAPVLAGSQTTMVMAKQTDVLVGFETASGSTSARKSKRQKCLDMMLPQDGVDCLKKLKAKK